MRFKVVLVPTVILIVSFVPWRFVGVTDSWRVLEETSNPLRKTLRTGLSAWAKAELMLVYATAQLQEGRVCRLSTLKNPTWICWLVLAQKLSLTLDQSGALKSKVKVACELEMAAG